MTEPFTVSDGDTQKMSTAELLKEYSEVKQRLAGGNLASWLVGRLESRKIQLACTLADNLVKLKE